MKNRVFGLLGVVAVITVSWLLFIHVFAPKKVVIGISPWVDNVEFHRNIAAFKEQFFRAGYVEGKSIEFIEKVAIASERRQRDIINEFIEKDVDLIFSLTTSGTLIAKELTKKTPIVFSIVTYPVEAKLIDSLDNSGNNLVGTRNFMPMYRQVDTFLSIVKNVRTIGFVHRKGEPNSEIQFNAMNEYGKKIGVQVIDLKAENLDVLRNNLIANIGKIDAVYSACDTLIQAGGEDVVVDFVRQYKVPDFTCNKSGVKKGSLIGNIADFAEIGAMSGAKALSILRDGKNPSELKSQSPENDFIAINLKRAEELNIKLDSKFISETSQVYNKYWSE